MSMTEIRIAPLIIEMAAPLHIGTGFRRGLVHRTVLRDGAGQPFLPASSLKGRVRSACESLLPTLGLKPCHAPYPQSLADCRRDECLACRIFGAPGRGTELYWHDAMLKDWISVKGCPREELAYGQFQTRTQVQLSRARGLAAEAYLYSSEASAPNLVFEAPLGITGYLELTPIMDDPDLSYELVLLLAGLELVHAIGGEVSRGLGQCKIVVPPHIQVNGEDRDVAPMLDNIGLLECWNDEKGGCHG